MQVPGSSSLLLPRMDTDATTPVVGTVRIVPAFLGLTTESRFQAQSNDQYVLRDSALYSVRMKPLGTAQPRRGKPVLGHWDRLFWVPLLIQTNAGPHYCRVNIGSLEKRLKLSRNAIRAANLETTLQRQLRTFAAYEQMINACYSVMRETHLLDARPAASHIPLYVTTTSGHHVTKFLERDTLVDTLGLSSSALTSGRFKTVETSTARVYQVRTRELTTEKLHHMALSLETFRLETLALPQNRLPLSAGRAKRLHNDLPLRAIMHAGVFYLYNEEAHLLQDGGNKRVHRGMTERRRPVVISFGAHNAAREELDEMEWYRRFSCREGFPELLAGFQLPLETGGSTVVLVTESYAAGSLWSNIPLIFGQPIQKRLYNITHIISQSLKAMRYIHAWPAIDRDFKPENILLEYDADGFVNKVAKCDFGLTTSTTAVQSTLVGSPAYVSPTAWLSRRWTQADDHWALGTTIVSMLLNRSPTWSADQGQGIRQRLMSPAASPLQATIAWCKRQFPAPPLPSSSAPLPEVVEYQIKILARKMLFPGPGRVRSTEALAAEAESIFNRVRHFKPGETPPDAMPPPEPPAAKSGLGVGRSLSSELREDSMEREPLPSPRFRSRMKKTGAK